MPRRDRPSAGIRQAPAKKCSALLNLAIPQFLLGGSTLIGRIGSGKQPGDSLAVVTVPIPIETLRGRLGLIAGRRIADWRLSSRAGSDSARFLC